MELYRMQVVSGMLKLPLQGAGLVLLWQYPQALPEVGGIYPFRACFVRWTGSADCYMDASVSGSLFGGDFRFFYMGDYT